MCAYGETLLNLNWMADGGNLTALVSLYLQSRTVLWRRSPQLPTTATTPPDATMACPAETQIGQKLPEGAAGRRDDGWRPVSTTCVYIGRIRPVYSLSSAEHPWVLSPTVA